MKRRDYFVLAAVSTIYLLIGAGTGLSWPLFRDEPMYITGALQTQESFPGLTFWLNINAIGTLLWAVMLEWVLDSVAFLRLSVLLFAVAALWLSCRMAGQVKGVQPGRALLLVAFVPEVFLYTFQVNGTLLTQFGAFWVCLVYLHRQERGATPGNDVLLWLSLSWVCLQSPFCLSFLPAVILTEWFERRRAGGPFLGQIPYRTATVAVLAFAMWGVFILLNGTGLSESLSRHSVGQNRGLLGLHFGNWSIFFVLWGGLFPLLGLAQFSGKLQMAALPWRRLLPWLAAIVVLGSVTLPKHGHAFALEFHTIYTMVMDRTVSAAGLPPVLVNVGYFVLLLLGAYTFLHFCHFLWRQPRSLFFITLLACYMTLMLVDGFIAARLFLPGWIALMIYVERALAGHPRLFAAQVGYQVLICAVYSVALGTRYGFLGMGG